MQKTILSPDEALERLKRGNADFLSGHTKPQPTGHDRRLEIALGQTPFAVLVGCSDSRVPPELLFGAGLGELFIVRNAGNSIDALALGSIEYGVLVLGAPLIVVLGHQRCGAVQAAVEAVIENTTFPGSLEHVIEPIIPAVLKARHSCGSDAHCLLETAIRENVRQIVRRLRNSEPSIIDPIREGKLQVIGAEYNLDEVKVDFFIED